MQTFAPTDLLTKLILTKLIVSHEVEEYAASIPGFGIDVTRTGPGTGPNTTRIATFDGGMISSAHCEIPMLGKARIGENTILLNLVTSAPPGSRWCGIDVEPGTVMLYGPESPHTGITPPGFSFSFVALDISAIKKAADRLELNLNVPDRGRVHTLNPTERVRSLTRSLQIWSDPFDSNEIVETRWLDTIYAAVGALSVERPDHEAGTGARIDSRHIVHVCIEYSEAIGRVPTISEMRLVAHVSERRLRGAFTEIFGIPPLRYFRYKFLTQARHRLASGEDSDRSVSGVASDLGFHNFGRFARHYQATYDELPSETLRTAG